MDQTIRFWDPVTHSYELTDPANNPHATMKPGYYKPLSKESTRLNATFKEVNRIYTGANYVCYSLRSLTIPNIVLNPKNADKKSQIEWLVVLKLAKPPANIQENAIMSQQGVVTGYGIERVKLEVPALHHDDIVPPHVHNECRDLIAQRRRQAVTAYNQLLPVTIERIYN